MTKQPLSKSIVIEGFGRQRVYPPVGRCIYCLATDCDLGDEHIIPQALGGNIILRSASCRCCEKIIGGGFEQRLTHKTKGMFAAIRLRHGYKSKRPKDRPTFLPFTFVDRYGFNRQIKVPAILVPRYWLTCVMARSPSVILGLPPTAPARGAVYWQWYEQDIKDLLKWYPGYSIKLEGAGEIRDLTRLIAKIAHAMVVAEYGIDGFEPWLPQFILGKEDCSLH